MDPPSGIPGDNDGVCGILYEFVELAVGVTTRQDFVLDLEMLRGVARLSRICTKTPITFIPDKIFQSSVVISVNVDFHDQIQTFSVSGKSCNLMVGEV